MRLEPGLDKIDRILYDLNGVASLIRKRIRGQSYWYARECQRVDGRPKIVWQQYLGRAQDLIDAVQGVRAAAAALYDLACRLRLVELIDRHVPKRGSSGSQRFWDHMDRVSPEAIVAIE